MSSSPSHPQTRAAPHPPTMVRRHAQRYAGIHMRLTPDAFTTGVDEAFPELFAWLAARSIKPAGAPFIRYHAMEGGGDGEGSLADLDIAVPVDGPARADGWVHVGELPGGAWLTTTHVGSFDGLRDATAALGDWSRAHGHAPCRTADGRIAGWAEHYLSGPREETDSSRWRTEIAMLVGP